MSKKFTYEQIATEFRLWVEYFDTGANMSEVEFNAMPVEEKIALQFEAFGPESVVANEE